MGKCKARAEICIQNERVIRRNVFGSFCRLIWRGSCFNTDLCKRYFTSWPGRFRIFKRRIRPGFNNYCRHTHTFSMKEKTRQEIIVCSCRLRNLYYNFWYFKSFRSFVYCTAHSRNARWNKRCHKRNYYTIENTG